jgi:hypothetical protein
MKNYIAKADKKTSTTDRQYSMFVGRWQPLHKGHQWLFNQSLEEGKNVLILDGEYTKYRDVQIGLSKLLINIHYNTNYKVFEYIRCEPWLSSGFTVLTENSLDNDPRAISVPYENLVDKACEILSSIDKQSTFISNTVVFYCNDLEMRNPQHYDIYETDKDIFIYNMALNCKNKGYNVIIYTKTILTEYNGIIFKNIKWCNHTMPNPKSGQVKLRHKLGWHRCIVQLEIYVVFY